MARYIDADIVLDRLPNDLPYKASVKRVLMSAPTADVEEVKHGEWLQGINNSKVCSICGKEPLYTASGTAFATTFYRVKSNYCPNCGAKMDGKESEDESNKTI